MAEVYGNSHFVLAALSSKDSSEGSRPVPNIQDTMWFLDFDADNYHGHGPYRIRIFQWNHSSGMNNMEITLTGTVDTEIQIALLDLGHGHYRRENYLEELFISGNANHFRNAASSKHPLSCHGIIRDPKTTSNSGLFEIHLTKAFPPVVLSQ